MNVQRGILAHTNTWILLLGTTDWCRKQQCTVGREPLHTHALFWALREMLGRNGAVQSPTRGRRRVWTGHETLSDPGLLPLSLLQDGGSSLHHWREQREKLRTALPDRHLDTAAP
ncbi:hypothetical protein AAFF_G00121750 [Aldrovandia affinis]|uniref:Uncharacterized protein n=1 Tax=Aldrovandia affinis TaxID=143900 RepID=A0AAD7WAD3_9TELE|nr:hypothetical protein AAFF_G00121750 [Aldrovandia affinis]